MAIVKEDIQTKCYCSEIYIIRFNANMIYTNIWQCYLQTIHSHQQLAWVFWQVTSRIVPFPNTFLWFKMNYIFCGKDLQMCPFPYKIFELPVSPLAIACCLYHMFGFSYSVIRADIHLENALGFLKACMYVHNFEFCTNVLYRIQKFEVHGSFVNM